MFIGFEFGRVDIILLIPWLRYIGISFWPAKGILQVIIIIAQGCSLLSENSLGPQEIILEDSYTRASCLVRTGVFQCPHTDRRKREICTSLFSITSLHEQDIASEWLHLSSYFAGSFSESRPLHSDV